MSFARIVQILEFTETGTRDSGFASNELFIQIIKLQARQNYLAKPKPGQPNSL